MLHGNAVRVLGARPDTLQPPPQPWIPASAGIDAAGNACGCFARARGRLPSPIEGEGTERGTSFVATLSPYVLHWPNINQGDRMP